MLCEPAWHAYARSSYRQFDGLRVRRAFWGHSPLVRALMRPGPVQRL